MQKQKQLLTHPIFIIIKDILLIQYLSIHSVPNVNFFEFGIFLSFFLFRF